MAIKRKIDTSGEPESAAAPPEPETGGEPETPPPSLGFLIVTCESPFKGARCEVLEMLTAGVARVRVLDGEYAGEETTLYESQCKTP